MGQSKAKRERFFCEHKHCCFCGGTKIATTIDHIPSRQVFVGRRWLDGYEFPACSECNYVTAKGEQVVAFLTRIFRDSDTEESRQEFIRMTGALARNHPEILEEFKVSPSDAAAFLRQHGISAPEDLDLNDLPLLKYDGPRTMQAIQDFSGKLFLALHYRHTGPIVPIAGGVSVGFISNAVMLRGGIPEDLVAVFNSTSDVRRGDELLIDQFQYRWALASDGGAGAYVASFAKSFALLGFLKNDHQTLPKWGKGIIVRPGQWHGLKGSHAN